MLEAIDAVQRFIRRNTRQAEPIPRGRLRREPLAEYSTVMVRELLVNAVAHADYSRTGETIKVFVFDDRVEIVNPGPMLPGLTTEDIRNGRSKIRNRGIAGVLRRIHYMERFGTAWEKIETEMAAGYPEPSFDGDGPVFSATLWPHPSFAGSRIPPSRQRGEISGGITGLDKGDVPRRRDRSAEVLRFLTTRSDASAPEVASHIGVSVRQARTYLRRLQEAGQVEATEAAPKHPERQYRGRARN